MQRDELSVRVGFDVSRETFDRLSKYAELLLQWSKTHNLIGPKERDLIWERHITDCLQIFPLISEAKTVLDIGSGAGLPGIVLACEAIAHGAPDLILVEPLGKRASFLRHVSHKLGLSTEIINDRIENVSRETVDVITARAVSDLSQLLSMSKPWTEKGAKLVLLKGQSAEEELTKARESWSLQVDLTPSKTDSFGVVLSISEVRAHHA